MRGSGRGRGGPRNVQRRRCRATSCSVFLEFAKYTARRRHLEMNPTQWIIQKLSRSKSVREHAIIVPLYRVATGEYQPENVQSAIDAYLHDTDIFNAINFISNAALSDGFYVTGDEDYK